MSEHQFETQGPVRLDVRIASGELFVLNGDDHVAVVGLEGSPKLLELVRVELIGDRLLIEERRKGLMGLLNGIGDPISVRASVPHGSRVEVATASSEVRLDGTFGGLEVKSASSDVHLNGLLDGNVDIKNANGAMRLERVVGDLNVRTVAGDVAAEHVGGSVFVKSVSADVAVGSVSAGKVDVQSVSGSVTLGIAVGSNVDVDAGSASGNLTSEIPLSAERGGEEDGPTVKIRVNTVSGNLLVHRANVPALA